METATRWSMAACIIGGIVCLFGVVPFLLGYETAGFWVLGIGGGVATLAMLLACLFMILDTEM